MEISCKFVKFEGTLQDLFSSNEDYTFLAGAGISMNFPSNLPSAPMLIHSFLEYMCPQEVLQEKINIKYELLIEVFRNEVDPELKFIEYFSIPINPNSIHDFLALMLLQNHFVVTTNFDQLIEHSVLNHQKSTSNEFKVAITKQDYIGLSNSDSKVLLKLHGSTKNIITGEITKQTIITTMDGIGQSMKHQEQLFVLPSYIHSALERVCSGRTLIFMGYGGGDGLDVLPELARNQGIQKIIWIEHSSENLPFSIEEFQQSSSPISGQELPKIFQLSNSEKFIKYKAFHHGTKVYKIIGNTSEIVKFIGKILSISPYSSTGHSDRVGGNIPKFNTWLQSKFPKLEEIKTYYLAGKIFRVALDYDTSFKYLRAGEQFYLSKYRSPKSAPKEEIKTFAEIKANIGMLYTTVRNYKSADLYFRSAYYLFLHINDDRGMGDQLHNIGGIFNFTGKPKKALPSFQKALSMYEYVNYKYGIANTLGDLGLTHQQLGDIEKSFEIMKKAYSMFKEIGDFMGMGLQLNNMGMHYDSNPEKAIECYMQAIDIFEQLGYVQGLSTAKNNIGLLQFNKEQYEKALKTFEEIYKIDEQRGDMLIIASDLRSIAKTYYHLGNIELALKNFEQAHEILSKSYPDQQLTKIVTHEFDSLKSSLK
ncbi:MAG: tetratricopeptide repeat protein [Promethearchaeota archaeon]